MAVTIGIRREDKNPWERRVPLTPEAVARLVQGGFKIVVQPSEIRAYLDEQYQQAGALISDDLSGCGLVLAVKEVPADLIRGGTAYVFFSHTIKGQLQNMPLLRKVLEVGATLIDYEPVVGTDGLRLVHFGRFAGIAGAVDGLWGLGQRLSANGFDTPLLDLRPAWEYEGVDEALEAARAAGDRIRAEGFPIQPLVIGVVGDGNVARGAHEVLDAIGAQPLAPSELLSGVSDRHLIHRVTFRESDTVAPAPGVMFDLADYRSNPDRYHSVFAPYLKHLTLLVNAMYWHERSPRLASHEDLAGALAGVVPLQMIADLSCDIDGGIQATVRATTPDDPVFVYNPQTGQGVSGFQGPGVAVLAVDHLPCELPRDASRSFSDALEPWIPALASTDFTRPVAELEVPDEWGNAVIAHSGVLAPAHAQLSTALESVRD